jgi:hypothetical protein
MRKTFVYCCILLWATFASAQDFLQFGWGGAEFDFEDSTQYNHVLIDSTYIWKIMKPDKEILFLPDPPHYFGERAIITNTSQYYPAEIQASFQFKLFLLGGTDVYCISFWHKYDFNPNVDGGIFETSWDYGATWQNIIFDSIIQENLWQGGHQNMYSLVDTISSFDNQPGFTGLNASGTIVDICFWCPSGKCVTGELDTLLIRFTIRSGNTTSNHEGWLLDNFSFGGALVGIEEIKSSSKMLSIYPNPTSDIINIKVENENIDCITIFSLTGQIVRKYIQTSFVDVNDLKPGIYLIKVNERYTDKLIIK